MLHDLFNFEKVQLLHIDILSKRFILCANIDHANKTRFKVILYRSAFCLEPL